MRERILMDPQWRFFRGDFTSPGQGQHWAKSANFDFPPINPDFDDHEWQMVDLPHDFVVEGDFVRETTEDYWTNPGLQPLTLTTRSYHMMHGFKKGGTGWYRKTFFIPAADEGRLLTLEFDGVFRNSMVWINKHFAGHHFSGYTGFNYDISALVNYGGLNTVVVRADATEYEGWFYEGGGIYRHVWLNRSERLHVVPDEVFVNCDVEITPAGANAVATVSGIIRNEVAADAAGVLSVELLDSEGAPVAHADQPFQIPAFDELAASLVMQVSSPRLWSLETPYLYRAVVRVKAGDTIRDEYAVSFGIRKIRFDADRGFFLNDKPVKLKGVCCHQDHAGLGSALPDHVQEYRIRQLKSMGCNAYRAAHHPPTPELLNACDRLGMLVMDENRLLGTAPDILTQLGYLVRRDRNHPSVIVWSLGNEEVFVQGTAAGARIAARMKQLVRKLDPSRPVTLAMNGAWGEGASDIIDILGCNYIGCGDIDMHHKKHPGQPIVFTESASATSTRGIYAVDGQRGYVTAYDRQPAMWGNTHEENWKHCDARPFVAGTFVWTGFDYRGEPTPVYAWPNISSHFGIIDTCGFPKDAFYYYKAWWTDEPVLHLMPHWNWQEREGQPVEVWVYSNCDEVELKLNGRSFGRQAMPHAGHLEWKVPYVPGELSATGWKQGRQTMTTTVRTTGHATGLRLVPDKPQLKADGEDALVVRVEVIDAHGQVVPNAGNQIVFVVEGPAQILGVGNGDPSCHEPDHNNVRSAFNGLCQVIIQSVRKPGRVTLTARADGLSPAVLELETREVTPRAWMPAQSGEPVSFACSPLQPGNDVASAELPASNLVYAPASPVPATGFYDFRQFHGGKDGLLYIRATYELFAAGAGALQYGADGPIKLWVNGQLVAVHPTASNPAKKEEYRSRVVWKAGVNEVIIAMTTNGGKAWGLFIKPVLAG